MEGESTSGGPASPSTFSGSISRRLGLAVLAFFFLMIAVGGVSSYLAWSILTGTRELLEENHHVRVTEIIHATMVHLVREIDRSVIEGSLDRSSHVSVLTGQAASTIAAFLDSHLGEEAAFPEKESEISDIRALQKLHQDLEGATKRIIARVAANARVDQNDLQILATVAHQLPVLTDRLNEIHYAKIRRLATGGVGRMKVILGAYMAFLVIGAACVILGIVQFSRSVALPLRRLASAILDIAAGDFGKRAPIRSNDEIGQLSQSFNEMAERLQRREEELRQAQAKLRRRVMEIQALYCIGVEISSMLDLDRILQSVVEKARALLQSEGAALCLFRPQADRLEVRTVSGSIRMSDIAVEAGGPRCLTAPGGCFSTRSEPCSLCMILGDGSPATGLAAPLRRGDEFLGALCVGWREPRPLPPEIRELLEGLAAQAAIAIENAQLYKEVRALATLQERERLAREMHDGLAQAVGYLHFRLKTLEDRLVSRGRSPSVAELGEIRTAAGKAYGEIRQSIFSLRTVSSSGMRLIPILTEYLHEFSQRSAIQVELEKGDARATRFSPEAEIQLIRVIQEALTNVRKHANARHAWVRFALDGDMARMTIADDGVGFPAETLACDDRHRFGLRTMRERAEGVGGTLDIHSAPGQGTRVVVRIPLAHQRER